MIKGMHGLFYSSDAEAARAFFRDTLGFAHVDAGDGWLIFGIGGAEFGVHPGDGPKHDISFLCDDIEGTVRGFIPLRNRREGRVTHIPIHGTDEVADVTGAGDTVIGAFALALAAGAEPLEAALLANYAGGIVVHKLGTATASPAELYEALADGGPITGLSWDES